MNYHTQVIEAIINNKEVLKATKYVSPKEIVRATRRSFKFNGRKTRQNENIEIVVVLGRPNYIEREFIKLCQKAKEPFPVKKIQLKLYHPKKTPLKRKLTPLTPKN